MGRSGGERRLGSIVLRFREPAESSVGTMVEWTDKRYTCFHLTLLQYSVGKYQHSASHLVASVM